MGSACASAGRLEKARAAQEAKSLVVQWTEFRKGAERELQRVVGADPADGRADIWATKGG